MKKLIRRILGTLIDTFLVSVSLVCVTLVAVVCLITVASLVVQVLLGVVVILIIFGLFALPFMPCVVMTERFGLTNLRSILKPSDSVTDADPDTLTEEKQEMKDR